MYIVYVSTFIFALFVWRVVRDIRFCYRCYCCGCGHCIRLQFSFCWLAYDEQWNTNGFSSYELNNDRVVDGCWMVRVFARMFLYWTIGFRIHKLMSILKRDPWKSITFNYLEIKPSLKSVSTVILGNLSEKMSFSRVIESTISLPVPRSACPINTSGMVCGFRWRDWRKWQPCSTVRRSRPRTVDEYIGEERTRLDKNKKRHLFHFTVDSIEKIMFISCSGGIVPKYCASETNGWW